MSLALVSTTRRDSDNIRERFRKARLRPTVARARVLGCVEEAPSPLAMEDIYRILLVEDARVQASTVYRALNDLMSAGLLQRDWVTGAHRARALYYPANASLEPQGIHRLMCRRCGHTTQFADPELQAYLVSATGLLALADTAQSLTISLDCLGCSEECLMGGSGRADGGSVSGRLPK